jgi:membrane-associated protein
MSQHLLEVLRGYFAQYGYWTIALALLLENAGVPVPGETVLLFASFLAFSERHLHLPWIIVVGTAAATLGDNLGYLIGRQGGRPLLARWQRLFHIKPRHMARGERLVQRHGPVAIFFARFVFGMRVVAGPLAGVLRMRWPRFSLFNALGAVTWVTVISLAGYFFGRQWSTLVRVFKDADYVLLALVVLLLLWWWIRRRSRAESPS